MPDKYDTLILVCEGPCNPDVRDYDVACDRHREKVFDAMHTDDRKMKPITRWDVVGSMSRKLQHTEHIAITNEHYRTKIGFCQTYVCSVCGHRREF